MSQPFVAEIRIVGFNFAPRGWAICSGQIISIAQNTALFSLLGTTYGGDGKSNFALPNFQTLAPMSFGQGAGLTDRILGETGGEQAVTLLTTQIASHTHQVIAGAGGGRGGGTHVPTNNDLGGGVPGTDKIYAASGSGNVQMNVQGFASAGSGQAHNNLPPYLTLLFVIALQGIFPARN